MVVLLNARLKAFDAWGSRGNMNLVRKWMYDRASKSSENGTIQGNKKPLGYMLEPRIMFDAAAVSTVVETFDQTPLEQTTETDDSNNEASPAEDLVALFSGRHEVAVIDAGIEDYQSLLKDIPSSMQVIVLEEGSGIDDIADILKDYSDLDAVHVFTHGSTGALNFSGGSFTLQDISANQETLAIIGQAMSPAGDLLLYGCNVGTDGQGAAFLEALAIATNADVAGSDDLTGHETLNADWDLEVQVGDIETRVPFSLHTSASFQGTLAAPSPGTVTFGSSQVLLQNSTDNPSVSNVLSSGLDVSVDDASDDTRILTALHGGISSNASDYVLKIDNTSQSGKFNSISFSSNDGSEFGITSMQFAMNTGSGPQSITITGYKDGVATSGSITATYTSAAANTIDFATAGGFTNVDEIRISPASSAVSMTMYFDDLAIVAAATSNDLPELGGTPADDTATEDVATAIDLSAYNVSDGNGDNITLTLAVDRGTIASIDGNGTTSGVTVSASGTGSMTLSGSAADLNSYLNDTSKITYTTAANDTTSATLTVTPNDGAGDGTADTVSISITAVNDVPTVSGAPSDVSVTEDTESNVDLSAMSFADVDGDSLTVTLTASAGTFSIPADGAGVGSGVSETLVNSTTITLTGTAADINTYLDTASNIKYTAASNVSGQDQATITVSATDGNGGNLASNPSVNIDVAAANDVPVFANLDGTPTFTEDGSATILDANVTVSDLELDSLQGGNGNYAGATLLLVRNGGANSEDTYSIQTGGSLTVAGSTISAGGNVIASFDTSSAGQLTVTFQNNGTVPTTALVNEVMQAIRYSNSSNDPSSSVQINWTFSDGNSGNAQGTGNNPGTASGSVTVSNTNVNDAPTLSATGQNPTYVEGAAASDLFSAVSASTVEAADRFSSMSLTVTNVSDGASEILRIDGTDLALTNGNSVNTGVNNLNISVSVTGTTATVSFSGVSLTGAQMQTLIDSLTYRNSSDNPTTAGNRVVTVTGVTDNGGTSGGGNNSAAPNLTSTISLTGVNDAPVIGNLNGDNNVLEPGNTANIDNGGDATLTNADSGDYNGGSLIITDTGGNNTANGNFAVDGTNVTSGGDATITAGESIAVGGVTIGTVHATNDGQGGNTLQIDFNANATNAQVQTLMQNLTWSASAGTGAQTFTATLSDADGTANSGDQDTTANFTMTLGNAPVLGGTPVDATINEDTATAIDLSAYNISDADNDVITLTLAVNAGTVATTDGNGTTSGVTIADSGSASMTLQGTASDLNTYLNDATKVVYTPVADSNTAATLTVTPKDSNITGSADTVTINITAVNDAPTVTGVPADVSVTEDTASNFDLSAVSFADVDGDTLTVTLAASAGTYSASSGGGVTIGGNGTGSLTLQGTAANINTYLDTVSNIKYTGASNVDGDNAATYTINVNDGTVNPQVGSGNIDIASVNDAPVLGSGASDVTLTAGQANKVDLSAYTIADVEGDTVTLTLVVDSGDLAATDGNGTTAGVTISNSGSASMTLQGSVADLNTYLNDTTKIEFTPDGSTNATLTVTPNDGTVNGTPDSVSLSFPAPVEQNPPVSSAGDNQGSASDDGTGSPNGGGLLNQGLVGDKALLGDVSTVSIGNTAPNQNIQSITVGQVMSAKTSTGLTSSGTITDPSAGVNAMSIVRNAVTGDNSTLNSFYGATSSFSGQTGDNSSLSLANRTTLTGRGVGALNGGLGGGLGSGGLGIGGGLGGQAGDAFEDGINGAPAPDAGQGAPEGQAPQSDPAGDPDNQAKLSGPTLNPFNVADLAESKNKDQIVEIGDGQNTLDLMQTFDVSAIHVSSFTEQLANGSTNHQTEQLAKALLV